MFPIIKQQRGFNTIKAYTFHLCFNAVESSLLIDNKTYILNRKECLLNIKSLYSECFLIITWQMGFDTIKA